MKKTFFTLSLLFLMGSAFCQNSLPFTKGINMLTYFETWNEGELPNLNKYNEADFACLKSMGIDVIRLPVHFDLLMEPVDTGTINELVLERLDQVCDWAEKYQIYLIIDNHSFNTPEYNNNPPTIEKFQEHLEAVWSQVAPRYNNRSKYIIYEILNEPVLRNTDSKWYKVQQNIIDTIRQYDVDRDIVVTGAISYVDTLVKLKPYKDPNLIYTFHYYEPHIFTHQGATWCGPEYTDLEGLPFPYDRKRLPKLKGKAKNSFIQDYIQNRYSTEGTVKFINSSIKKAAAWGKKNNVRVWCGEMGAKTWINSTDRLAWINATRSALEENNIPYCIWGIDGSDGFLTSEKAGLVFPDDIDIVALEAYGFSMPDPDLAKKASLTINLQKPYLVYDGLTGKSVSKESWGNIRETKDDEAHNYCMTVSYPNQQNGCKLILPGKISSKIAENPSAFSVSFAVKFTDKNQVFNLCLRDSDKGEEGLPWKKGYTIKASDYKVNEWITVEIPISKFTDFYGVYSNVSDKYYDIPCQFEWSRLETLYLDFDDFEHRNFGELSVDDVVIKMK